MRNLLRDRRGAIAFMTVIALVPLIGFIALGAEAGSWYVTRQQAQNTADAAAYSGGLTLACALSESTACDTGDYVVRGEEFAARNGFCNSGATYAGCPVSLVQTVEIDRGTYSGGVFTESGTGDSVRAIVRQETSVILASILGLTNFNIGAEAIVTVQTKKDVCALGLGPATNAITIGGDNEIKGNGCALMSDTAIKFNSAPSFEGPNWAVQSANGCNGGHCDVSVPHNYSALPARNPLSKLDDESYNTRTGNTNPLVKMEPTVPSGCPSPLPSNAPLETTKCYSIIPNSSTGGAYKGFNVNNKDYVDFLPGTYFFYNATIKVTGGYVGCSTCTKTGSTTTGVTFVLLGSSSIDITGGTVVLNAPTSNSFDSDLDGILFDDQSTYAANNGIKATGGTISLGGTIYSPNNEVILNGNTGSANTSCMQVIANSITLTGTSSYLSSEGCAAGSIPKTQVVALVK